MWRTPSRISKETPILPYKTPTWLSMEENLTAAMAFAIEAIPLSFARAKNN